MGKGVIVVVGITCVCGEDIHCPLPPLLNIYIDICYHVPSSDQPVAAKGTVAVPDDAAATSRAVNGTATRSNYIQGTRQDNGGLAPRTDGCGVTGACVNDDHAAECLATNLR